jgi:hypothetical protein
VVSVDRWRISYWSVAGFIRLAQRMPAGTPQVEGGDKLVVSLVDHDAGF